MNEETIDRLFDGVLYVALSVVALGVPIIIVRVIGQFLFGW